MSSSVVLSGHEMAENLAKRGLRDRGEKPHVLAMAAFVQTGVVKAAFALSLLSL